MPFDLNKIKNIAKDVSKEVVNEFAKPEFFQKRLF